MEEISCGWVAAEKVTDEEIYNKFKSITRMEQEYSSKKNGGETAYGYFVDLIRDNYPVTLEQCDRVAKMLIENMDSFKYKLVDSYYEGEYEYWGISNDNESGEYNYIVKMILDDRNGTHTFSAEKQYDNNSEEIPVSELPFGMVQELIESKERTDKSLISHHIADYIEKLGIAEDSTDAMSYLNPDVHRSLTNAVYGDLKDRFGEYMYGEPQDVYESASRCAFQMLSNNRND